MKQGLYYLGNFKSSNYSDAIKTIFELNEIPSGFCVNADHPAEGYSIVDKKGVQHIYELSPVKFYDALMGLN